MHRLIQQADKYVFGCVQHLLYQNPHFTSHILSPPTDHRATALLLEYFYWWFLEKNGIGRIWDLYKFQ
jgi:hypothetical protein